MYVYRNMQLVPFYLFHILTILGWRTFDPQGSFTVTGRQKTTGAQEVMTMDKLQLHLAGGRGGEGGVVGGSLTFRSRTLRGDARCPLDLNR